MLLLHPLLLQIQDEFLRFWDPLFWGLVYILIFFLCSIVLVLWPLTLVNIYTLILMLILAIIEKYVVY